MFELLHSRTLILVNIPMALVFSILVLVVKINFPRRFKGSLFWFLSLFLPMLALVTGFFQAPPPPPPQGPKALSPVQTRLLIDSRDPMQHIVTILYVLGNIFLEAGWRQFYGSRHRPFLIVTFALSVLLIPPFVRDLRIHPDLMVSFFNFFVILSLCIYLFRKRLERHVYSSLTQIVLAGFALASVLFPVIVLLKSPEYQYPYFFIPLFSLSYMFRNSFVLLTVYTAVMHRFKVDLRAEMERKEELLREVEQLAVTDTLTGLYNRRGFEQFMEYEFRQSRREESVFSVSLGDIDHFKTVNDTWGHDCGDYVIQTVADTIRKNVREQDCLARWGGEEFILMFKGRIKDTAAVIERIRKEIEDTDFSYGEERFRVTVSFGIAEMSSEDNNYEKSVIEADRMLYRAKEQGRNRIEF